MISLMTNGGSFVGLDFDNTVVGRADGDGVSSWRWRASAAIWRWPSVRARSLDLVAAVPVNTMAAKSIPGFNKFEDVWYYCVPLGWDVTDSSAVAKACIVLLSDWFPATTGEIIDVDGGYHATGA